MLDSQGHHMSFRDFSIPDPAVRHNLGGDLC